MSDVTVVIPNYNGIRFLEPCLHALAGQTVHNFDTILVDNGSADHSVSLVRERYPWVRIVEMGKNIGFCGAVNEGIRQSRTPYVILLNNDTEVFPDFVEQMVKGMEAHPKAFSGSARMIQASDHTKIDDAGNYYNALGWGYARGKNQPVERYDRSVRVFSACGGAAVYRKSVLDRIGVFDEAHFAYLEDLDIGYRARIYGYENWYFADAKVYHVGSGSSGSRHNEFKVTHSSRNNVYLIHKNMPVVQWILNLPFLALGFAVKTWYFKRKGFGTIYREGLKAGRLMSHAEENRGKKVPFTFRHFGNYFVIQMELWINLFRRRG